MGGSSNNKDNSFIPKRGPATRTRHSASRRVYLFTLISYVLFFATLVASAGVFLYNRYIDQQLTNEVAALNEQINQFRQSDMDRLRTFNERLEFTDERLSVSTTLGQLFTALENTTAASVQLASLALERIDERDFEVVLAVNTDSFDSSILQREFLEQDSVIESVAIESIEVTAADDDDGASESAITFIATLGVPLESVAYQPVTQFVNAATNQSFDDFEETSSTTSESLPISNQNDL